MFDFSSGNGDVSTRLGGSDGDPDGWRFEERSNVRCSPRYSST